MISQASTDDVVWQCPVCASAHLSPVAKLNTSQVAPSDILRCADCRLEFIHPLVCGDESPRSAVTATLYRQAMKSQYHDSRSRITSLVRNRIQLYTRLLGRKPQRILEVGAGTGWMVKEFADQGLESCGIELNEEFIEWARHNLHVSLINGDITDCDLTALGNFDVVYSSQTLEHILTPQRALLNMTTAVRTGGLVHIDVPNANSWGSRVRRWYHGDNNWGVIKLPHHQIGYYPATLKYLLQLSGLQVIQVSECPTTHPVLGHFILPNSARARMAILGTRLLGHGYLLVALAQKMCGNS
jgi:2-polyprenyl-3-methyl-5-hydroxy-6-metoxy-1,4-benzoquinol methylase